MCLAICFSNNTKPLNRRTHKFEFFVSSELDDKLLVKIDKQRTATLQNINMMIIYHSFIKNNFPRLTLRRHIWVKGWLDFLLKFYSYNVYTTLKTSKWVANIKRLAENGKVECSFPKSSTTVFRYFLDNHFKATHLTRNGKYFLTFWPKIE